MFKRKQLAIIGFCTVLMASCSLPITSQFQTIQSQLIETYNFEVKAGFQLSSVDSQDLDLIEDIKKQFLADLQAGKKSDYQKDKDFSIHLLSGSEGNYFTSPEFTQNSLNQVLATLVVVDSSQSHVFKGEYQSPRFVFADPQQEFEVSERTKAYLLTAENGFDIQTYKGEIIPEQELSPQTTPSNTQSGETQTDTEAATEALSDAELAEAALERTEFRASVPGRKIIKEKIGPHTNQSLPYAPAYPMYASGSEAYPAPYRQAPQHLVNEYGYTQAFPTYGGEYGSVKSGPYPGEFARAQAVPAPPGEFGSVHVGSTQAAPVVYPMPPQMMYLPGEPPDEKQIQAARERRRQVFEAMKQESEKEMQYRRAVRPMSILDEE